MAHDPDPAHGGDVFVLHDRLDRFDPHGEVTHTEHGLTYLVDGWFRMEHGGPVEAGPGTFTIVPAGVPHRPLAGADMEYWLLSFCATCLRLDEGQPLMSPFQTVRRGALPVLTVDAARRDRVLSLFEQLQEEQGRTDPETRELVRSLVLLLLGEARRAMSGDSPASPPSLAAEALEVVQRRCLEPISLRDVAAAVHRTPSHVANVVKAETGHSVGDWIRAGRVAEAAARLVHTDDGLDVIAEHVGWADTTHFIRQFKKTYGVTPAAWRRAHRASHPRD